MNEALYGLRESVTATPNKLEVFTDGFHAAVSLHKPTNTVRWVLGTESSVGIGSCPYPGGPCGEGLYGSFLDIEA